MAEENDPKEPETNEPGAAGGEGESAANEPSGAQEPGADYSMLMEKLSNIETNQAALATKVQALTDAQSVLVDAGAVICEVPTANVVTENGGEDAYIPLEELDFSI